MQAAIEASSENEVTPILMVLREERRKKHRVERGAREAKECFSHCPSSYLDTSPPSFNECEQEVSPLLPNPGAQHPFSSQRSGEGGAAMAEATQRWRRRRSGGGSEVAFLIQRRF
ncbi:hypothetical protein KSP39_PZI002183 [Platanthera zijinensis]|uniref:Uncharacterized protein n=1 Tax=Platanthera zijinensis TaxID=2320716 RepID=A0AAP0BZ70_9ASPA